MKKTLSVIIYTAIIVLFTAVVSCGATLLFVAAGQLNNGETMTITLEDYELLQRYQKLSTLSEALDLYYYEDVDQEVVENGAAYGMVASLGDPYSTYLTSEDMAALMESDSGEYVGIGGTFLTDPEDGSMVITRIYPDSPLSQTDAQVGDRLYAVNGEVILGMDSNSVAAMIKGDAGTSVTITLLREGEQREYTITRERVEVIDVDYRMLDGDILLVNLGAFSTNADTAFAEAIEYGQKQDMKSLIIDLRNNGGGDSLVLENIADLLLPEGTIFYTEDKHGNRETFTSDAKYLGLPIVVLCDGNSASASEVLIAALQDYELATIVGTTTFGKAIGQSTLTLNEDGSGVYLTTIRVYSPQGRNWHGAGLEPDVVVELPDELASNPISRNDDNDLQLQEAIRILQGQTQGTDAA